MTQTMLEEFQHPDEPSDAQKQRNLQLGGTSAWAQFESDEPDDPNEQPEADMICNKKTKTMMVLKTEHPDELTDAQSRAICWKAGVNNSCTIVDKLLGLPARPRRLARHDGPARPGHDVAWCWPFAATSRSTPTAPSTGNNLKDLRNAASEEALTELDEPADK